MSTIRSPLGDATNRSNAQPTAAPYGAGTIDLSKAKLPSTSTLGKRKDPADSHPNLDDTDSDGMIIDKNPDQVRRMINRFIDNGGMKVGEFCDAIGVSNNAYNRFLKQSGATKGLGSDVFTQAWNSLRSAR